MKRLNLPENGHGLVKFSSGIALLLAAVGFFVSAPAFANAPGKKGSPEKGREIYMLQCLKCHGENGEGDGPAASYQPRPPRDFGLGVFKIKTSVVDDLAPLDTDIFSTIGRGISISGMPPFKNVLTDDQRWDLVAYIKTLSDLFDDDPSPRPIDYPDRISFSMESVEKGRTAFVELKCHECHGEKWDGNGIKKLKDDSGAPIRARNLALRSHYIGPTTPEALYARITVGIPFTPMPVHDSPKLTEKKWHIVNFITYLLEEEDRRFHRNMTITAVAGGIIIIAGLFFIFRRKF